MKENYLKTELYELVAKDKDIFEFIQSGSLDGIWYWDLEDSENEWMSDKFWELFGIDPSTKEHKAEEWQDIINKEDLQIALANFNKHLADPKYPYDQIVRYQHTNGSTVWVRCRGIAIRDEKGKPLRMLGAHQDVTELKELHHKLEEKNKELTETQTEITRLNRQLSVFANTDKLTNLYNRHFLGGVIEIEQEKAKRNITPFSIVIFDLNKFKEVNDNYGHLAGDAVLVDFANRLKHTFRKQDIICRWGGDEFLVLFTETDKDKMKIIEEKIVNDLSNLEFTYDNKIIKYGSAYGSSTYLLHETLDDTLKRADDRMYENKNKV